MVSERASKVFHEWGATPAIILAAYEKIKDVGMWKKKTKGWRKESARHALARRGIRTGTKVEMEHAKTIRKIKEKNLSIKEAAIAIASDHLKEDPAYYEKLKIVESAGKKDKTIEDTITVQELLPEYKEDPLGELTLSELKIDYPPLYNKIKHWEELGEGLLQAKRGKRVRAKGKTTPKTVKAIQSRINKLLFYPAKEQKDSELLEITVRADKTKYFNFLKGYTRWGVEGRWRKLDEKNELLEIQFKDTPKEAVGNELMDLLKEYNRKVVKEKTLYARTISIEESSLNGK